MRKFFYPSRASNFFERHGLDNIYHEITSALLALAILALADEKKLEIFGLLKLPHGKPFQWAWPPLWTTPENISLFHGFLYTLIVLLLIKILLYLNVFSFDRLCNFTKHRRKGINFNGFIIELIIIIFSTTIGIFFTSITVEEKIIFIPISSHEIFVSPITGIIICLICLILLFFIHSKAINLNALASGRGKFINFWATGTYLQKADWNVFFKDFLSTLIGLGVGFYLYESNLIFIPGQIVNQFNNAVSTVIDKTNSIFNTVGDTGGKTTKTITNKVTKITKFASQLTNEATGTVRDMSVHFMPNMEENEKKYWMIGTIIICGCIFIKFLMYKGWFSFNKIRNAMFGMGRIRELPPLSTNEVLDEILMYALTSWFGVMADPFFHNLRGQTPHMPYPYGQISLIVLAILVLIKLCFITDVLDFDSDRRNSSKNSSNFHKKHFLFTDILRFSTSLGRLFGKH